MATNFPTSLDTFTNPNSGNTLDSPSHSVQHSDINDAVEAIEAKIGVGSSTAGSATAGYALVNTSGGTTAYSLLGVSGLSSGTAVANTVLTANGSGGATFAPTAQGLTLINTTSFTAVASEIIPNIFSATYDDYKVMLNLDGVSADGDITVQLRAGTVTVTSNYQTAYRGIDVGAGNEDNALSSGSYWNMGNTDSGNNNHMYFIPFDLSSPFRAQRTVLTGSIGYVDTAGNFSGRAGASNNLNATSYESLVVGCSSGNITGSVRIYGYNK
jgi:hypothetical protein